MNLGLTVSGLGHAALLAVAFVVLAHPRLWDATTQPVVVELVTEKDINKDATETKPELALDKPETPPDPSPQRQPGEAEDPPPHKTAGLARTEPNTQDTAPQSAPPPPAPAPAAKQSDPFTASPLFLPTVVPGASEFGFDTNADVAAKLSADEIAALQAHLQKCWHPPAGVAGAGAEKLRAMVRIALTPQGALAREPLLIRASASTQGPRPGQAAVRALV